MVVVVVCLGAPDRIRFFPSQLLQQESVVGGDGGGVHSAAASQPMICQPTDRPTDCKNWSRHHRPVVGDDTARASARTRNTAWRASANLTDGQNAPPRC
uniref:Secreted protein n=1 Tax=Globodera rostochiensis TaxID=31243 RepID=A0A914GWD4_GLORO